MKKKFILVFSVFSVAPLFLLFLILYSLYLLHGNVANLGKNIDIFKNNVEFKALPERNFATEFSLFSEDMRVAVLDDFLTNYKSPLSPFSEKLVTIADKYNIDYRLMPAIAMQESNLCKKIPKDSYNCWGFGVYGKKMTKFSNYDEAIDAVAKTLAKEYIGKGYESPDEIMQKYTPSNNGAWADSVSFFMDKLTF